MPSTPSVSRQMPFVVGLGIALLSAVSFGSSGTFGTSLMAEGWSPGAVVTLRIVGAALLMAVPTVISMRGRWYLFRGNLISVLAYGFVAVAACQFAYFMAVDHLSVGVALLLEYLAPVLIVGWMWAHHGRRPSRLTLAGVGAAIVGLVLVLDVASGAEVDLVGVLWGLLAAVGLVVFFLVAAHEGAQPLPPIALAGGGLAVGAASLVGATAVGLLPWASSAADVTLAGWALPWWVAVVELALVAGAIAYATGIAATRILGSTVASFVGLSEVLIAVGFAWVLVGEAMGVAQMLGGVAILAGVVMVKLGDAERATRTLPAEDVDIAVQAVPSSDDGESRAGVGTGLADSARVH
ncbi:DMT family transporter [Janibacter cremeus]|uniref:Drug/metabolite transporter (DMT)-like permease n=1 Tax=Janibacter cremeus TaxID=1285192 RepID=A0A852VYW5_9MICO|nr:drug/metabolite transporter (DMT)-like permease [Janibacter cremeus]